MNALLSVKPKYVDEILNGSKMVEFRKAGFSREINKIWIYSSSPVKKIVAVFEPGEIVDAPPDFLWEKYNDVSGMHKDEFFHYFEGKPVGYAIPIENLKRLKRPVALSDLSEGLKPPQSFLYLDTIASRNLRKNVH